MSRLTNFRSFCVLCMLVVGLLWHALPAHASIDPYGHVTFGHKPSVSPSLIMEIFFQDYFGNEGVNAYVGRYNSTFGEPTWAANSPYQGATLGDHFFCIEAQVFVGNNYKTYEIFDLANVPKPAGPDGLPMAEDKANLIRELWGRFFDQTETNIGAAAFQLAIWEIVYEDYVADVEDRNSNWNLRSGNFRTDSATNDANAAVTQALTWLRLLDGDGPRAHLLGLSNLNNQDFVIQVHPIPEPASLAIWSLIGLSFVGAGMRRRRRLRAAQPNGR